MCVCVCVFFSLSLTSLTGGAYGLMAFINIIGSQPAAYVSDRFGRKKAMVPGAILVASSICLLPFATEAWELVSLLTLWGTGSCLWGSTPTAYVADLSTPQNRSQSLALLRSGGDFGLMLGAMTTGWMVDLLGMSFALQFNAGILFSGAVVFSVFARESFFHRK